MKQEIYLLQKKDIAMFCHKNIERAMGKKHNQGKTNHKGAERYSAGYLRILIVRLNELLVVVSQAGMGSPNYFAIKNQIAIYEKMLAAIQGAHVNVPLAAQSDLAAEDSNAPFAAEDESLGDQPSLAAEDYASGSKGVQPVDSSVPATFLLPWDLFENDTDLSRSAYSAEEEFFNVDEGGDVSGVAVLAEVVNPTAHVVELPQ